MNKKTKKDLWSEMSIREIWTQAHFAGLAYTNIDRKGAGGTDGVFSSIHSFFSHCAMVSKMLKAKDSGTSKSIGDILGVSSSSPIHDRKFRNFLEHYDRELKKWIENNSVNINIGSYNVGPKSMIQTPNIIFVSHYDPSNNIYTFVNEDVNLTILHDESIKIKNVADNWVKQIESGSLQPPFV